MDGDVVITFNDGKTAVYSASLLHATFSQADEVNDLTEAATPLEKNSNLG